jgi:hypothetical protein
VDLFSAAKGGIEAAQTAFQATQMLDSKNKKWCGGQPTT